MSVILLDLDGTLVDSFPGIRSSFIATLDEMGWPRPSEQRIAKIPGPPMEQTLASLGMSAEQAREGLSIYLRHYRQNGWTNSSLFDGTLNLLQQLRSDGHILATATSKGEHFAHLTLDRFGLLPYLHFVGAAQEDGPRRTKEAVLEHVFSHLKLHGRESEILMVGDRSHDYNGAAAYGIASCAVTWGYGSPEEWALATYTASDPHELKRIIDEHYT